MRLAPLMPLVLLGLAAGCASTPVKKQDLPALARADALVLDGCYDCLLEARAIYERVGGRQGATRSSSRVLFETQLLLALREKELAIDSTKAHGSRTPAGQ